MPVGMGFWRIGIAPDSSTSEIMLIILWLAKTELNAMFSLVCIYMLCAIDGYLFTSSTNNHTT